MSLSEWRSANETFVIFRDALVYSNGWLSNAIANKKNKKKRERRKNTLECINSRRSDNIISVERCKNRSNAFAYTFNFEIILVTQISLVLIY